MYCSRFFSLVPLWHCSVCWCCELQPVFFKAVARWSFLLVKSMSLVWLKHLIGLLLLQNLFSPLFILAVYMTKSTKQGEREWRLIWARYLQAPQWLFRSIHHSVCWGKCKLLMGEVSFNKGAASCFAFFIGWELAKGEPNKWWMVVCSCVASLVSS